MPAVKDTVNLRINLNSSGTEANPYNIETVVTDVADTTYIEQVNKVIYLKRPLYVTTGFLLVPDYLTVVMLGGSIVNTNNSATTPTNGVELRGGCTIVFQSGLSGFGATVQWGTGTIKLTQVNGIYPTLRQQNGARHDTFLSTFEQLTPANYANVIYKIDGANIQLSNEGHFKWYTTSTNSYIRNVNVQPALSNYTGGTPTAFQLHYGSTITEGRTSVFAVSGDFSEPASVSRWLRPIFDINTASPIKGYMWRGTWIDIVDPRFAAGGSWNGLLSPDGAVGSGTGVGSRLRWKTTYNATVSQGNARISGVKIALYPSKTTSIAVPAGLTSEAVANTFVLTAANGQISEQTLLYKEYFTTTTTANQASNTTTTWRITCRHPQYEIAHELQASAGLTSLLFDSVSAVLNPACTLTKAQAESASEPYANITFTRATTTIALSAARTVQELKNYAYWWLYQNAQMDFADPFDGSANPYNIGSWALTGAQHLNGAITTTGNITFSAAPGVNVNVTGAIITTSGTNAGRLTATTRIDGLATSGAISSGGSLNFGAGSIIAATGNMSMADTSVAGTLTINTATTRTLTLSNVTGAMTINVTGGGTLTVILAGTTLSSVLQTPLPAGVTVVLATSLTLTGLTAGSSIYISNSSGQVDYVASSGTSYTRDTTGGTGTWSWKVARYGFTAQTGTFTPASASASVAVSLVADPFITQTTVGTVAAYTMLQNPDRMYDYAAYFETTNSGIPLSRLISKQGTNASLGAYNATFNSSGGVWSVAGNSVTMNTSSSFVAGVTMAGGLITTGIVTVTSSVNVATSLTCDVINAGTLSGRVTGNVTNTGTLASGVNIVGNVSQTTPNSITGVTISGTLTYNTNTPITIAFTNCNIGTLLNNGTGLVTITQTGSSVTTYTDPEINYLDSRLTASGVTSVTIYSSAANRDSNTAPGATFSSVLDFRFGSTVSGVVMSGTVYLRVLVSGITLFSEATLTLGSNVIDLGVQGQLASINSKVNALPTTTEIRSELATELSRIDAPISTRSTLTIEDIPEGLTANDVWNAPTRTLTENLEPIGTRGARLSRILRS